MTQPTARTSDTITVDVNVDGWRAALSGETSVKTIAVAAAGAALVSVGPEGPVEIGVRLTGDKEMRSLNNAYRGQDKATNVLSFSLTDREAPQAGAAPTADGAPELLGDVVVAFETCVREADVQIKPLADHLRHMVVHGVLHLLGYDHEAEDEAMEMEELERKILADLGVPDPYARAAA